MKLPSVLKKLLKEKDITLSQLSRATNISVQTLSNWMQGQSPRSVDQLKTVADFLDVDLNYLCFAESIQPQTKKPSIKEFEDEINCGVFEVVLRKIRKKKQGEIL